MEFRPINIKRYQVAEKADTSDTVYWRRLSTPTLVKEFGAIDYIHFNPADPNCFAVTNSVRVQIYNSITKLVVKNLSRFEKNAYGANFRQDGNLLVAGDEQGLVKLFNPDTKNVLRVLRGHNAPVHRAFFTSDLVNIVSFSDDHSVKLWNIANSKCLHTYEGAHDDYIRAGVVNPRTRDAYASGGYDGKIKLYDARTNDITACVDHGSPVESLLYLPSGCILISAGGTEMRVWDVVAGCKLLANVSQHHKTITTLCLGSNGRRIFSGSLDRSVKIYDVATYRPVHTLNFPNSILSLDVAPKDLVVAAGTVDGLVSIQNMAQKPVTEELMQIPNAKRPTESIIVAHVIKPKKAVSLGQYDRYLCIYAYANALTYALGDRNMYQTPEETIAVMQELIYRKGLERAIKGLKAKHLKFLVQFICLHIGEQKFMRILIDAANCLLNAYEDNFDLFSSIISVEIERLASIATKELDLTYDILKVQGMQELLIDGTRLEREDDAEFNYTRQHGDRFKPNDAMNDIQFVVE